MTDMDRETLEHLLRPADPSEPLPEIRQTAVERAEVGARIDRIKAFRQEHAKGFDALFAHRDGLDDVA